ncbi:conserved hypothetical protein [Histoplasma capsulatum var. duboisii H88]|uniref:Uncharacterized protein n=1 Tax=Ajellomyces capsulatus (strain H88) TaxID=544711 RepID=F0UV94_AJEC8|nr:conserved hypothetical protein [Histoplasma capsulatum var. duboisii H88]
MARALVLSINIQLLRGWNKWRVVAILCFRPELLTSYASQLNGTPSTVWPQLEIVHQQPTCWLRLNHSDVRYIPLTPGPFLLVVFQVSAPHQNDKNTETIKILNHILIITLYINNQ